MRITINEFLNLVIRDRVTKEITERGFKYDLVFNNGKVVTGTLNTIPLYQRKIGRTMLGVPFKPGIYLIREISTFRFYVGSASNLCKRRSTHLTELLAGKHFNPKLNVVVQESSINHYEFHYFFFDRKDEDTREILYEIEQEILNMYGGTDMCFNIGSDVRAAQTGRSPTKEARLAQSLKMIGRKKSDETRARMSAAQKIHSKINQPHIRKRSREAISRSVYIEGKAYRSVDEFCRQHKMTGRTVRLRIASKDPQWSTWNYVDQLWST